MARHPLYPRSGRGRGTGVMMRDKSVMSLIPGSAGISGRRWVPGQTAAAYLLPRGWPPDPASTSRSPNSRVQDRLSRTFPAAIFRQPRRYRGRSPPNSSSSGSSGHDHRIGPGRRTLRRYDRSGYCWTSRRLVLRQIHWAWSLKDYASVVERMKPINSADLRDPCSQN